MCVLCAVTQLSLPAFHLRRIFLCTYNMTEERRITVQPRQPPRYQHKAPEKSSSSGIGTAIGWGVAIVGTGLLLRTLFKGTAPGANSVRHAIPMGTPLTYAQAQAMNIPSMPPGRHAYASNTTAKNNHASPRDFAQQQHERAMAEQEFILAQAQARARAEAERNQQQQQQASTNAGSSGASQTNNNSSNSSNSGGQQKQSNSSGTSGNSSGNSNNSSRSRTSRNGPFVVRPKSDFEKYEEFAQAEREHFSFHATAAREAAAAAAADASGNSTDGGDATTAGASLPGIDTAQFELNKEQARADFVQSKWMHLKRGKKKVRFQTWRGTGAAGGLDSDEPGLDDAERAARREEEAQMEENYSAYKAMQRQMATHPQYVQATQLLFAGAGADAAVADAASAASAASSSGSVASPALPFFRAPAASFPGSAAPQQPLTVESVRSAYFVRAKQCHPDVAGGNKEQFQRLTAAYELLMDALEPMERKRASEGRS